MSVCPLCHTLRCDLCRGPIEPGERYGKHPTLGSVCLLCIEMNPDLLETMAPSVDGEADRLR